MVDEHPCVEVEAGEVLEIEAFRDFARFERQLRFLLEERLQQEYAENWVLEFERVVPKGVAKLQGQLGLMREKCGVPEHLIDGGNLIQFLSYSHYLQLAKDDSIYNGCFASTFPDRSELISGLEIISFARHEVAHGRTGEVADLQPSARLFLRRLRVRLNSDPDLFADRLSGA